MSTYLSLQEAITDKLRISNIAGIKWGNNASPFYETTDAPVPLNPLDGKTPCYVEFEIAVSSIEDNFVIASASAEPTGSRVESYDLQVRVVAGQSVIMALGSPDSPLSVPYYLDGYTFPLELLDGATFRCIWFLREGWECHKGEQRSPGADLVWIATSHYKVKLQSDYPPKRTT